MYWFYCKRGKNMKGKVVTMGQRSQIYVRHNDTVIVANYYGWNYGERMISRARYGMEFVKGYLDEGFCSILRNREGIEKLSRVFDVNFDMKDVAISSNLVQEWKDQFAECDDVRDYVFGPQNNNDGKLFVDIQTRETKDDLSQFGTLLAEATIKYALLDADCNVENIMDAEKYMEWDMGKNWMVPSEYFSQEDIDVCKANIDAIKGFAMVMTKEEVEAFLVTERFRLPDGEFVRAEEKEKDGLEGVLSGAYERASEGGTNKDGMNIEIEKE